MKLKYLNRCEIIKVMINWKIVVRDSNCMNGDCIQQVF